MTEIRVAKQEDIDEIALLLKSWHQQVDIETIKRILKIVINQCDFMAFVAIEENKIVGYYDWVITYNVSFGEKIAEGLTIFVHQDYRRKGIARQLLTFGIAKAKERGCTMLRFAEVAIGNTAIQNLYKSVGCDIYTYLMRARRSWE